MKKEYYFYILVLQIVYYSILERVPEYSLTALASVLLQDSLSVPGHSIGIQDQDTGSVYSTGCM